MDSETHRERVDDVPNLTQLLGVTLTNRETLEDPGRRAPKRAERGQRGRQRERSRGEAGRAEEPEAPEG